MSHLRSIAMAFILSATAGCAASASGAVMTPQIVDQSGTEHFSASYDKVFNATVDALKSEGFPIATAEPKKGLIKTGQKVIRTAVSAVSYGHAATGVASDITRQYLVRLSAENGAVMVSAEPRIFQGNAELTDEPIWDLDSPQGERALWKRLFRDIRESL